MGLNVNPQVPEGNRGKRYDVVIAALVIILVVLLISTVSIGVLYVSKQPATIIETSLVTMTGTQAQTDANPPVEFYFTYNTRGLSYYIGAANQSTIYSVNASITSASLRFENSTETFKYYLYYPTSFFMEPQLIANYSERGSRSNITLNANSILNDAKPIEQQFNYNATPVEIYMNITALPQGISIPVPIYSLKVGQISFQSAQGDFLEMFSFNYQENPIP